MQSAVRKPWDYFTELFSTYRSPSPEEEEEAAEAEAMTDTPPSVTLQQRQGNFGSRSPATPDVRLYHRAVVVAQESTGETSPA